VKTAWHKYSGKLQNLLSHKRTNINRHRGLCLFYKSNYRKISRIDLNNLKLENQKPIFDRLINYMRQKITVYAMHFCLCIAFLLLPYGFNATENLISLPNFSHGHDRTFFGIYFLLLIFLYLNYYVLIPKFYFHQKHKLYFGIIFIALLFFLWISNVLDKPFGELFHPDGFPKFDPNDLPPDFHGIDSVPEIHKPSQYTHTILVFIIGVISSLFFSINKRLQYTENEKMQAELSLLKAQINPHFLFNTLNSIYSLAIRNDVKTADSIVQLSELMRYIMNNANDNAIQLDQEINYINNYISLQKSRLEDTVNISYLVKGNAAGKKITPLILISFIENAFKHGVNPEEHSEIDILIDINGNDLNLLVYNRKVHSVQTESGIGMRNTLERLEHLYPKKHQLYIEENDESYSIKLKITL